MSISAGIGLMKPDGTIWAVILHFDGYIANGGAGEILAKHYTDPQKVEKLISLGYLCSLGAEVDPNPTIRHSWSNPQPNVTVAYHRDRNDPLAPAIKVMDKESFPEQARCRLYAAYAYLFENGRWLVCDLNFDARPWEWKVLSDVLTQGDQD